MKASAGRVAITTRKGSVNDPLFAKILLLAEGAIPSLPNACSHTSALRARIEEIYP